MPMWNYRGRTILREGRIAVRDFPEHLAADIDIPGGEAVSDVNCYLILIDYLSGCNASHRPVILHAPVEQTTDDEWQLAQRAAPKVAPSQTAVRFELPEGPAFDHFPEPTDSRVHLRTVPASRTATIWFVGGPSPGRAERHTDQLLNFIALKGLSAILPGNRPAVRASMRGPFNILTELSISISEWPVGNLQHFNRPMRRIQGRTRALAIRTP